MDIAARLCSFGFKKEDLDLLVHLYEGVIEKECEFSLKDAAKVKTDVKARERQRNVSDMLDKVSEKVA